MSEVTSPTIRVSKDQPADQQNDETIVEQSINDRGFESVTRMFGKFFCNRCQRAWYSSNSWKHCFQLCKFCRAPVRPSKLEEIIPRENFSPPSNQTEIEGAPVVNSTENGEDSQENSETQATQEEPRYKSHPRYLCQQCLKNGDCKQRSSAVVPKYRRVRRKNTDKLSNTQDVPPTSEGSEEPISDSPKKFLKIRNKKEVSNPENISEECSLQNAAPDNEDSKSESQKKIKKSKKIKKVAFKEETSQLSDVPSDAAADKEDAKKNKKPKKSKKPLQEKNDENVQPTTEAINSQDDNSDPTRDGLKKKKPKKTRKPKKLTESQDAENENTVDIPQETSENTELVADESTKKPKKTRKPKKTSSDAPTQDDALDQVNAKPSSEAPEVEAAEPKVESTPNGKKTKNKKNKKSDSPVQEIPQHDSNVQSSPDSTPTEALPEVEITQQDVESTPIEKKRKNKKNKKSKADAVHTEPIEEEPAGFEIVEPISETPKPSETAQEIPESTPSDKKTKNKKNKKTKSPAPVQDNIQPEANIQSSDSTPAETLPEVENSEQQIESTPIDKKRKNKKDKKSKAEAIPTEPIEEKPVVSETIEPIPETPKSPEIVQEIPESTTPDEPLSAAQKKKLKKKAKKAVKKAELNEASAKIRTSSESTVPPTQTPMDQGDQVTNIADTDKFSSKASNGSAESDVSDKLDSDGNILTSKKSKKNKKNKRRNHPSETSPTAQTDEALFAEVQAIQTKFEVLNLQDIQSGVAMLEKLEKSR